jgi:transcriptional regulator with XRE-family HTH domain
MTRETLAYRAGLTVGSVARIELGQSSPGWTTVQDIARALDMTMAELAAAVEAE